MKIQLCHAHNGYRHSLECKNTLILFGQATIIWLYSYGTIAIYP